MSKRTDIHRPSAIITADYDFVGYDYLGEGLDNVLTVQAYRAKMRDHMARTGAKFSQHDHAGTCHICGAHAIYTARFHHRPTNTYICTGLDCADKLDHMVDQSFRKNVQKGLQAVAGKRKAEAFLAAENMTAAWDIYNAPQAERTNFRDEESTITSMVGNLVKYGNLSEKQVNYISLLLNRIANRARIAAEREAERAKAAPVPVTDKRIKITGQVVSIKTNDYFGKTDMLVKTTDGYMLYGTLPSGFTTNVRGANVSFMAKVKPSTKDPKFGYFSRPSQATLLAIAV